MEPRKKILTIKKLQLVMAQKSADNLNIIFKAKPYLFPFTSVPLEHKLVI